eukprot:m.207267 g.207267  ORF g.207267 m.207267 type:complete len:510 (-) comp15802_c0_seq14:1358-2887(-)
MEWQKLFQPDDNIKVLPKFSISDAFLPVVIRMVSSDFTAYQPLTDSFRRMTVKYITHHLTKGIQLEFFREVKLKETKISPGDICAIRDVSSNVVTIKKNAEILELRKEDVLKYSKCLWSTNWCAVYCVLPFDATSIEVYFSTYSLQSKAAFQIERTNFENVDVVFEVQWLAPIKVLRACNVAKKPAALIRTDIGWLPENTRPTPQPNPLAWLLENKDEVSEDKQEAEHGVEECVDRRASIEQLGKQAQITFDLCRTKFLHMFKEKLRELERLKGSFKKDWALANTAKSVNSASLAAKAINPALGVSMEMSAMVAGSLDTATYLFSTRESDKEFVSTINTLTWQVEALRAVCAHFHLYMKSASWGAQVPLKSFEESTKPIHVAMSFVELADKLLVGTTHAGFLSHIMSCVGLPNPQELPERHLFHRVTVPIFASIAVVQTARSWNEMSENYERTEVACEFVQSCIETLERRKGPSQEEEKTQEQDISWISPNVLKRYPQSMDKANNDGGS